MMVLVVNGKLWSTIAPVIISSSNIIIVLRLIVSMMTRTTVVLVVSVLGVFVLLNFSYGYQYYS